jgi:hypothetical protein
MISPICRDMEKFGGHQSMGIPTKAATYSNLIAATIPI